MSHLESSGEVSGRWQVHEMLDAIWCGALTMRFAKAAGFGEQGQWAAAITVEELVTNAVKHAGGGTLYLERLHEPSAGMAVVVEDNGPGIADVSRALEDGYSRGRFITPDDTPADRTGLGSGLGAVRRLMDEVLVENKPQGGLRVTARKYIPRIA
jgi:serine/threonine-protein kinase RsbT